jgi:hypothetical protein
MQRIKQAQVACLERTLAGMDWLARRRGGIVLPAHLLTGTADEDAAFFFLQRKGYVVVARRWASGDLQGDVDLIAWQGGDAVFHRGQDAYAA